MWNSCPVFPSSEVDITEALESFVSPI